MFFGGFLGSFGGFLKEFSGFFGGFFGNFLRVFWGFKRSIYLALNGNLVESGDVDGKRDVGGRNICS